MRGNDSVAVVVGVVAECDIVFVFERDKICHCPRRRTVHTNFAVVVKRHEAKRVINVGVDNFNRIFNFVDFVNQIPVENAGAAERVCADVQTAVNYGVHVDNAVESFDVGAHVIHKVNVVHLNGFFKRDALDNFVDALSNNFVGAVLDNFCGFCACRAASRRVVFDAAVGRRIVARRDDYAVGLFSLFALVVVREDNAADDGRRNGFKIFLQDDVDTVSRQNFDAGTERGFGKGVGVRADVERSLKFFGGAVFVDCLRDCQNVLFVEATELGAAAVAAGAERHALSFIFGVGAQGVVIANQ